MSDLSTNLQSDLLILAFSSFITIKFIHYVNVSSMYIVFFHKHDVKYVSDSNQYALNVKMIYYELPSIRFISFIRFGSAVRNTFETSKHFCFVSDNLLGNLEYDNTKEIRKPIALLQSYMYMGRGFITTPALLGEKLCFLKHIMCPCMIALVGNSNQKFAFVSHTQACRVTIAIVTTYVFIVITIVITAATRAVRHCWSSSSGERIAMKTDNWQWNWRKS